MGDKSTAIYLRISDDREGRELGVQRQEEDCLALLQRLHDARLAGVYKDNDIGASTRSKKRRPEFERLLADARAGRVNHIVAYTSGRLTRRPREHEDLIELAEQHGVTFDYVRSPSFDLNTAAGRRVARILAANDAGEAEDIAERVARAREQIRSVGGYLGGPRRYGRERDGKTLRPYEADVLRDTCARVLRGESLSSIVRRLNKEGVPPGRWHPPLVVYPWMIAALRNILKRPDLGSIVDEPVAAAVRAVLANPARKTTPGNQPRWLGSRLYLCGVCHQPNLVVSGSPRRYRCLDSSRNWQPGHIAALAAPVDEFVEWAVVSRLSKPDARAVFAPARPGVDVDALTAEDAQLAARLAELEDMLGDGELTRQAYRRQVDRIEQRRGVLQAGLVSAGGIDPVAQLVSAADVAAAWFGTGPDRVGGYSIEQRRTILKSVARVTIQPGGAGGARFNTERIKIEMPPPAD